MAKSPDRTAPHMRARKRPPRIVLVVACSQRKRVRIPPELRLASIRAEPDDRAARWRQRLDEVEAPRRRAEDLYAGDHWQSAREAYRLALEYSSRSELWAISAGYGLIPATKQIKPYSATFSAGSADSVWRGQSEGDRQQRLSAWWRGVSRGAALADLLPRSNEGVLIIAAGAAYIDAVWNDVQQALALDQTGERVSLISAGSRDRDGFLPVLGHFRSVVGGTHSALNARVLAWLTAEPESHRFRRSSMAARLDLAVAGFPAVAQPARQSATDDEIGSQIREMTAESPTLSRTRALRHLRDHGIACEQGRFASIWRAVAEGKPT